MDKENLRVFVKGSISPFVSRIKRIILLSYYFSERRLSYYVYVSSALIDEELEELRISQTEVLSAFPDGEISTFEIFVFLVDSKHSREPIVVLGDVVFFREKREIAGKSICIFEERASGEE